MSTPVHFVVRQSKPSDLSQVLALIKCMGYGITSLPAIKEIIAEKITRSAKSFEKSVTEPQDEIYFFVMEDLKSKKIVGCCGILAQAGFDQPFYNYKVTQQIRESKFLRVVHKNHLLHMVNDYQNLTEIGMLFLLPEHRHHYLGQLLSRCRFLYIAENKRRFTEKIIVEIRGVIDAKGSSPFWKALGGKFIDLSFLEVDSLIAQGKQQFVADLMPTSSIYVPLLPETAQRIIGKPHKDSAPALTMLKKEGFEFDNYINIFEGGPCLVLPVKYGLTINHSQRVIVKEISKNLKSASHLIATVDKEFRACVGQIKINADGASLCAQTASALRVGVGESLRCIAFA